MASEFLAQKLIVEKCQDLMFVLQTLLVTAGSHYCCTAQDSLNGDQLTAHFEVHLEKHT